MKSRAVRTLMTHGVATVHPTSGLKEIVDIMAIDRVNAVPVVDTAGRVVGVVSEADLIRRLDPTANTVTASDLMTAPAVTVGVDATVAAAARLLQRHNVERLPVLDCEGRLVGVLSRRALLASYLRTDEDIRVDVREHVLLQGLLVVPHDLTITVHDGLVTLSGAVDRRSTARIAGRLVRGVTGVVDVANHLRWEYDDDVGVGRRHFVDARAEPHGRG